MTETTLPTSAGAQATAPATLPAPVRMVHARQLQRVCVQVGRSPYVVLPSDAFIAWLLMRSGSGLWVLGWVLLSALTAIGRAAHGRRMARGSLAPGVLDERLLLAWFFVVGMTRIWPIGLAFNGSHDELHYLVTLIMMGLAAGGVTTSAGVTVLFVAWIVPVWAALVSGWLSTRSFEGPWISLLLTLMFALLVGYVRDYGRSLERELESAEKLRIERDRAESERERAETERERAEKAIVARTRFFAAASHDLRQPLGVLRWYGDAVVAHATRLDHEALLSIGEGIGRALERAEPLVRKYLDIARIDAHSFDVMAEPCNLAGLLELIRDAYAREAIERNLVLRTELGSSAALLSTISDEGILQSILDNLVGNALKFTPSGEVVLDACRIEEPAPRIRVRVRDTGIGISRADHEHIFDDFYQVGNLARASSKGVGLGLAIARRQSDLLGVKLHLDSAPGRGSTFWFDLPVVDDPIASAAPAPARPDSMAQSHTHAVLVVDDEPEVRLSLRLMLEAEGWRVRTASGLQQALDELQVGFAPDALVVDFRLQGELTGTELVSELRASGCAAPAVVVTGDTDPDRLALIARAGLPMLHKPVQGRELIATILKFID